MLASLHIENIAVIRELDVDFSPGFTVLTGETGAGKSVMTDSIRLLMGAKAERGIIRHGEESAMVSALFTGLSERLRTAMAEWGVAPDEEGNLELQRAFSLDGKSTSRINGRAVSLSVLREVAMLLIHIHGQDDTGFLKKEGSALAILDAAAHNIAEKEAYLAAFRHLNELRRKRDSLRMDEDEKMRQMEMLRYQLEEIEEIKPKPGEEEQLFDERLRLRNSEKITKQLSFAYRALRGGEKGNVSSVLERSVAALRTLSEVLPEAEKTADKLDECLDGILSAADEIRDMNDFGTEDPTEALDRVETRMAALSRLTRKYGGTLEKVLAFAEKAGKELTALENNDRDFSECEKQLTVAVREAREKAAALRQTRLAAAEKIKEEVTALLKELDMPKARFDVLLSVRPENDPNEFSQTGCEEGAFTVAINPNEPLIPVEKCASGGEMSRIMLAIKCVIARHDALPTLIFDEVDSGVSGKTSRKVGLSLLKTSRETQIFCITHSAQIASLGDTHLCVTKKEVNGRAESAVTALTGEERLAELSRILGGIHVTEAQRQAAADMLNSRE